MRVTIVREDGTVIVNDRGFSGLDLSFLPSTVHAVQWYGNVGEGEVEYVDERQRPTHNETITDLSPYQPALDAWQAAKLAEEAEAEAEAEAAAEAESTTQDTQSEG